MINTQIFLRIEKLRSAATKKEGFVAGSCVAPAFKNWIYVSEFKWGMNRDSARAVTSASEKPSTVKFESLSVTKVFDQSSTVLYSMLKAQDPITELTIVVVDFSMGDLQPQRLLELKYQDGHVRNVELDLKDDDDLGEEISFSFKKMSFQYFPAATAAGGGRTKNSMPYEIVPMGESPMKYA